MDTQLSSKIKRDKSYPVFDRYLWWNPEICNNCFSKVKERIKVAVDQYRLQLRPALRSERHFRTENATLGYSVEEKDSPAIRVYQSCTTCKNCGSVRAVAQYDTLSRKEAMKRASAIADRLEEIGFVLDENKLYKTVREGKSRSSIQNYDREIFAIAVKHAVVERPET